MKSVKDNKRKGVFIPDEFFELGLTDTEMIILAIYRYYTVEGNLKCCVYTNQNIADMTHKNVQTVIRAKKRLKERGYIRTNGGIKTYYQGINKGNNVQCNEQNVEGPIQNVESEPIQNVESEPIQNVESEPIQNVEGPIQNVEGGLYKMYNSDIYNLYSHNKEEKRIKKENNKEIIKNKKRVNKEEMKIELKEKQTVFERVVAFMGENITKEQIDYLIENHKDKIDNMNKIKEDDITEYFFMNQAKMVNTLLLTEGKIKFNNKELPKKEKDDKETDFDI